MKIQLRGLNDSGVLSVQSRILPKNVVYFTLVFEEGQFAIRAKTKADFGIKPKEFVIEMNPIIPSDTLILKDPIVMQKGDSRVLLQSSKGSFNPCKLVITD